MEKEIVQSNLSLEKTKEFLIETFCKITNSQTAKQLTHSILPFLLSTSTTMMLSTFMPSMAAGMLTASLPIIVRRSAKVLLPPETFAVFERSIDEILKMIKGKLREYGY